MIIYIDFIIIINFIFDFLILKTISITLKRTTTTKKLILSSLIGELSILLFYFNNKLIILLIFKILLAIIMNIIAFTYQNLKTTVENLSYFYMISIIIAGFIYFLKQQNINYFLCIFLVPIILLIYKKQTKKLKATLQNYYQITIDFDDNNILNLTAYLDTGNTLIDPITKKPIVILDKKLTQNLIKIRSPILVPIKVLNNTSLLQCIKPKSIIIENKQYTKVLIGLSNDNLNLNGAECLLNLKLMEE